MGQQRTLHDVDALGATPYQLVSAATTNATVVKSTPGIVTSIVASNVNAAARYLKLYNKATAPTVGTDVPVQTYMLPPTGTVSLMLDKPLWFSAGIAFALTTGAAVADTAAVAASELLVNIGYA